MLRIDWLNVCYDRVHALKDVSLEVGAGGIVSLIGANGAGKSTLIKCVAGLLRPRSGTVTFDGQPITGLPAEHIVRRGIASFRKDARVFPVLSVIDNLEIGAYSRPKAELRSGLERGFELFPLLRERRDQLAGSLSGGEQQSAPSWPRPATARPTWSAATSARRTCLRRTTRPVSQDCDQTFILPFTGPLSSISTARYAGLELARAQCLSNP